MREIEFRGLAIDLNNLKEENMKSYRIKTKEEIIGEGRWDFKVDAPEGWSSYGLMNHFLGQEINEEFVEVCDVTDFITIDGWSFAPEDYIKLEK